MSPYTEVLLGFYGGEVAGEAIYSVLVGAARNDVERLKWATLMQLETETKAWLRGPLLAHGVSIEEQASDRDNGIKAIQRFKELPWQQQMKGLRAAIVDDILPRFERYADGARSRERG
ncbi:MAG TPA: hypothetical protein VIZ30_02420 [Pseudomonadales bacterium]